MRVMCAWCGRVIVPGPNEYVETSHGICDACCTKQLNKIKRRRKIYNEKINCR